MTILRALRPPVKLTPLPMILVTEDPEWFREFGSYPFTVSKVLAGVEVDRQGCDTAGQVEAIVAFWTMPADPVNIFALTAEDRELVGAAFATSRIDESFLAELDPSWELLPKITGEGLTPEEYAKIMHRADRVRADYLRDVPAANDGELNRVGTAAAKDALRSVLKARPAAPCCDSLEERPCMGCSSELPAGDIDSIDATDEEEGSNGTLTQEYFDAREVEDERERLRWDQKCSIPAFKITDDFGEVYFEAGYDLTLEKVIAADVAKLIAHPDMFTAERVVWERNCVMAVIGKRSDGEPFVTMLDETDEDEADQDPTDWPAWTDEDVWEPTEKVEAEEATLSLAGLIESEAAVMRARGLGAYDLMAGALVELARVCRVVDANRPDQVAERLSILENYTEHALARDWELPEPELNSAGQWA